MLRRLVVKKSLAVILALLLLVVAAGCGSTSSSSKGTSKELTLGLTAPLTGDNAEYGNVFKNAIELALEKVNSQGGINGA